MRRFAARRPGSALSPNEEMAAVEDFTRRWLDDGSKHVSYCLITVGYL